VLLRPLCPLEVEGCASCSCPSVVVAMRWVLTTRSRGRGGASGRVGSALPLLSMTRARRISVDSRKARVTQKLSTLRVECLSTSTLNPFLLSVPPPFSFQGARGRTVRPEGGMLITCAHDTQLNCHIYLGFLDHCHVPMKYRGCNCQKSGRIREIVISGIGGRF
jgi:hypothetical protein